MIELTLPSEAVFSFSEKPNARKYLSSDQLIVVDELRETCGSDVQLAAQSILEYPELMAAVIDAERQALLDASLDPKLSMEDGPDTLSLCSIGAEDWAYLSDWMSGTEWPEFIEISGNSDRLGDILESDG